MHNGDYTFWLVLGFVAQGLFASRFVVQWIASEKKGTSIIPIHFWFLSLAGGMLLLIYAVHRQDPVFIAGQAGGLLIYSRNLVLIRKTKATAIPTGPAEKMKSVV